MSRPGYVDKRGNHIDRARRRAWLLASFDVDLGSERARCALRLSSSCLQVVDADSLSVDRKVPGGTYARSNIQPACKPCQDRQGWLLGASSTMGATIAAYRDACDARAALRESGRIVTGRVAGGAGTELAYYQLDDAAFDELHPPLRLRDWLEELAQARQDQAS